MVPVGGAIVAGPNKKFINAIAQNYPGRASMSPILDVFITLLSMGSGTWKALLKTRKELFKYSQGVLQPIAEKYGERILTTKGNAISIGISLGNVCGLDKEGRHPGDVRNTPWPNQFADQ